MTAVMVAPADVDDAPVHTTSLYGGALRVVVERVPARYARGCLLSAAGYTFQVIADADDTGRDRVRVQCEGVRVSRVFDRYQYPRASIFHAVGVVGVQVLTGCASVDLKHTPHDIGTGYVGRQPIADADRRTHPTHTRHYSVNDIG